MEVLSLGLMISFLNQISYFVVSNLWTIDEVEWKSWKMGRCFEVV
jgi:hypothetical protein